MSKWDSLFAEADEEQRVAKMSPSQRAAYSFMTGDKNKQAYLEQTFGKGNAQRTPAGDYEIRAGEKAPWSPTNPKGLDLGDLTGLAGGATEYVPAIAGAFMPTMPIAGAVAGQVLGRSGREAIASKLLDNGTQKNLGDLTSDYARSGAEAAIAGGVGKAIGAGVRALRPGARLAEKALAEPMLQTPPPLPSANPLFTGASREVIDPANPVIRQAYETLAQPSQGIMSRVAQAAKKSPDMIDLAMTATGHPEGVVVRRAGNVLMSTAQEALAKNDARAIAKVMSQPGGLELLKKLAATGRNAPQAVIVGEETLGLGLGGR